MKKGIIILSGGLDSTVLAHHLLKEKKYNLAALSFDYGQKHKKELECAAIQAQHLGIEHQVASLGFINELFTSSLLSSGEEIPEGHYQADNMKSTVVPNRNMILISIAAGWALSRGASDIFYGAHAGDHTIYPDCRPEFIQELKESLAICDYQKLDLKAPFEALIKEEIVKIGFDLDVDFSQTWTCYKGQEKPCGKCGSCVERLEAFEKNGRRDPLEY